MLVALAALGGLLAVAQSARAQIGFDRPGGDYRNFDLASDPTGESCKKVCEGENRCRAWTYVRPGYLGASARCYLKKEIKAPRRRPCCLSGVVR